MPHGLDTRADPTVLPAECCINPQSASSLISFTRRELSQTITDSGLLQEMEHSSILRSHTYRVALYGTASNASKGGYISITQRYV